MRINMEEKKKISIKKMSKKAKRNTIIIVIILIAAGAFAFFRMNNSEVPDEVITAEYMDVFDQLEFAGNIEPNETRGVYSVINQAKVSEVLVKNGDFVHKGDPLVKLDSTSIEYEIKGKELALEQIKLEQENNLTSAKVAEKYGAGSLESREAAVKVAQTAYDEAMYKYAVASGDYNSGKTPAIVNAQNAVREAEANMSVTDKDDETERFLKGTAVGNAHFALDAAKLSAKEEVDNLFLEVAKAEANLEAAKADYAAAAMQNKTEKSSLEAKANITEGSTVVEQAEVELNKLKADYENYTIKAQCDGYISGVSVKVGDTSDNKLLMNILDYEGMKISIDVDEYDIKAFHTGDKVRVYVTSMDQYYDGIVDSIATEATKKNELSYIKVVVKFSPSEMISSGLGATIYTVPGDDVYQLAVPCAALNYDTATGSRYVFVNSAEGPVRREVTVGETDGENTAILDGLTEGEEVVIVGSEEDYE